MKEAGKKYVIQKTLNGDGNSHHFAYWLEDVWYCSKENSTKFDTKKEAMQVVQKNKLTDTQIIKYEDAI